MANYTGSNGGGLNLPGYIISASTTIYVLTRMAAVPSKIVLLYHSKVIDQSTCGIHITKFKFETIIRKDEEH
jgi:hypothetical protein